jgi:hypothetical protein
MEMERCMTQDEIIEMAKQAGFSNAVGKHIALDDDLERFAKFIASAEREACAKLCEELSQEMPPVGEFASKACAKFIRGQA